MIEAQLLNYGVLGAWTLTLLWERYNHNKKMQDIINNNTLAMQEVKQTIQACKIAKKRLLA